jgi:CDP-glycerol glycerophosphotransferase
MLVADIGITDYSSWILDYILTRKPGFLFVKDEESYRVERDFYYPIDEAPLPVARSNKELLNRVLQFDAKVYEKRINKFLLEKGSVEDGYACKRIVDHIDSLMGKS